MTTKTTVALFDLDHTLLPIDSDFSWGAFVQHIGWADRVYTVPQAAELGRFDRVTRVWLVEDDVDGDLQSYGLADLQALGFEKTGLSVPTHRSMLIELTR